MKPGISKACGGVGALAFALSAGACAQIAGLTGNYNEATGGGAGAGAIGAGDAGATSTGGSSTGGTADASSGSGGSGTGGATSTGGSASTSSGGLSAAGGSGSSTGGASAVGGAGTGGASPVGGASTGGSTGTSGGAAGSGGGAVVPVCGNGVVEPAAGETCDDHNTTSGDGCSATCDVEAGFVCSGSPSVCTHPSCAGLAKTCGPSGNADCCGSSIVTGITSATFYRSYDGMTTGYTSMAYPAEVSDFRLDTYEITVGRFRNFVAAYSQTMIASGAGKNPNNSSDTGWSTAWNASLEATATALTAALQCNPTDQTWTDTQGSAVAESLPISCLDWYDAEAFCIWDGGRLPTEAEWNYAASGGTQQRVYPWGSAAPDCTYANFTGAAGDTDFCTLPGTGAVNRVGSESPKGDGRYGQADLAGNVFEWVQDMYADPYTVIPCDNCSYTTGPVATARAVRGGGFAGPPSDQLSSGRFAHVPSGRLAIFGARCARTR